MSEYVEFNRVSSAADKAAKDIEDFFRKIMKPTDPFSPPDFKHGLRVVTLSIRVDEFNIPAFLELLPEFKRLFDVYGTARKKESDMIKEYGEKLLTSRADRSRQIFDDRFNFPTGPGY